MKAGLFMMPSHPPERPTFQAHQWDLECLTLADKLGLARPGSENTSLRRGSPFQPLIC